MLNLRTVVLAALVAQAGPATTFAQVVTPQQTLQSPTAQGGGRFAAVAVDGAVAVVGAWRENVGANATQGAAYVYGFNGTTWVQRQRLLAADGAFADQFGTSVAISGTTILVGAFGKQNVPGPDYNYGAAYIFVFNGTTWVQQAKLVASDTTAGAGFGSAVALHGDVAVIGASLGRPGGTGARSGTAYVFERSGTTWTERRLDGGDHAADDYFGGSVGVSGTTVCVGAQSDVEGGVRKGSAYVFVKNGATWPLQQKLVVAGGSASDYFGTSCSVDGDTLAVGAPGEGAGAGGYGGVHLYARTGTVWTLQQHVNPTGLPPTASLGSDVAVRGDLLVAGASSEEFLGAVYFFERVAATWVERQRVINSNGVTNDGFGQDVAQDGQTVLVGAANISNARPGFVAVFRRTSTAGAPGAPRSLQVAVTGNQLALTWTAPAAGSAPTGYTLIARTTSGAPIATLPVGNATSFAVTAPNGAYRLSVQASNAAGVGPESNTVTVTVPSTAPVPGAPAALAASVAGTTVSLSWSAPTSGGAATGYVLLAGTSPGFVTPFASLPLAAGTSVSVPGVPAGTYYVRLLASNAAGVSTSPSNEVMFSVAGESAPQAPVMNAPSVSGRTVALSWSATGGGAVASYVLTAAVSPGGAPIVTTSLGTSTSATFTNVPGGTYFVRVRAANGAGTSAASNEVTVVVP